MRVEPRKAWWKHPAVWVWGLVCVMALGVILRSSFTTDMSAFMPKSPSKQQQLLVDQITVGSVSRMVLMGLEGGTAEERKQLSLDMAERMRQSEHFTMVANGAAEAFERDRAFLFDNRYALSPGVTPERFSVQGLQQAIGNAVYDLSSPAGIWLKRIFPRDPTGELMTMVGELQQAEMPSGDGVWSSKDGKRALLLAQAKAAGSDTDGLERALQSAQKAFDEAQLQHPAPQVHLLVSGAPKFAVDARDTISSEASMLSSIGIASVVILLLLVYRSPWTVGASLLPVLTAVAVGIACVSLLFGSVHGITIGFGTTLIGEAVDYSIYYFVQSSKRSTGFVQEWKRKSWPTIRLGVLTSVIGFSALVFAGFEGLAQLGVYSIVGLVTAALVTRYVLTRLPLPQVKVEGAQRVGEALAGMVQQMQRARWMVWVLGLAAAAVVAWYAQQGQIWNRALSGLSPVSQEAQDLDESLRKDLGQPELRYLVVITAPDQAQALQMAEQASVQLQGLVKTGDLGGFETPTRYLPSPALQAQRQAAIPSAEVLQQNLAQALQQLPVERAVLQPFVDDVEKARTAPVLTPDSLRGTALSLTLDAMLVQRGTAATVLLPLRSPLDADGKAQGIEGKKVQAALQQIPVAQGSEVLFIDIHTETRNLYDHYFGEALQMSLLGLLAIMVLLGTALRSSQRLLRVMVPIIFAECVVVAGLLLLGYQLTLLHLIGMLLVVAVGSNYTLFFDSFDLQEREEAVTLVSLLVANIATVMGFGILAFSSVPVLKALGSTVGPGAIVALLFAAILSRRSAKHTA